MHRFNIKKIVFIIAVGFLFSGDADILAGQDLIAARHKPVRIIVIDPGHGGSDHGVIGREGTAEKDVTLALARLAAVELRPRYQVLLTRTGDYKTDIADRIAMANHHHADLFLSLHVGGGFSIKYGGITVYSLNAPDEHRRSDSDFSLADISVGRSATAWDGVHYDHHRLGKAFAKVIKQSCRKVLGDPGQVKSDRIAVLQGADMPAVMLEIGCLTNPAWEKRFRNPDRLSVMSDMICRAIDNFFQPDHSASGNNIN